MRFKPKDFLIFLGANLIGFMSVPICFFTLFLLDVVSEDFFVNQSQISFEEWSVGILMVWIICLAFSIAGLLIKQKERIFLMLGPAFIPVIYGFSVLFLFGGLSL